MQSWFAMRADDAGGAGEVLIYDEIGTWGVSARRFVEDLKALGPVRDLAIRINSPGGSGFDAVAIYNALARHPAHKTVWVDGFAASAASIVAMAGDEIVMPENTMMMIHDPVAMAAGGAEEMRAMAGVLDRAKTAMVGIYAAKSERSADEIGRLMSDETWMSAQEAFDLGFADRVEPAVPSPRDSTSPGSPRNIHPPPPLRCSRRSPCRPSLRRNPPAPGSKSPGAKRRPRRPPTPRPPRFCRTASPPGGD